MNRSEFQQRISSSQKPIVIDFWAPWCAPCRATKPVLEKLAREFDGKVEFVPVNADESQEVLQTLKVYGIPTVITFRNGLEVGRVVGARSESGFRALFEALATGKEAKVSLTQFDRMLRLGAGALFIMVGMYTSNWLVVGIGAVIVFMGIHDRCPIWRAITCYFKGEEKPL